MTTAEIITDKGTMKVEFFEADAPKTVDNFVGLAKKGYYDGLTFHRVIPNFVIQGVDLIATAYQCLLELAPTGNDQGSVSCGLLD